jgi:hypothetical protein
VISCRAVPSTTDGDGIGVGEIASGILEFGAVTADFAVGAGVICGDGVALGISNRPRRCGAVGETGAAETGVEVARTVAALATVAARRGVVVVCGVDIAASAAAGVVVAAIAGAGVAVADVDVVDASVLSAGAVSVASAFTNFFDGAFGGGVASDFILARVFLAAS